MSITPLPAPPSRDQSEVTFVTNANAFLGALPTFATEANALAVEVEAASTAAVGAANYQGEYSAGTTYQIGQSVSYLGTVFIAKTVNTGVTPVAGANWINFATESVASYVEFTASGTYTKPGGAKFIFVEAIGGGGSGGRGSVDGSGGGGGGFNSELFRASDVGATVTVTIGAGGAAKPAGSGTSAGNAGGNTTFGALVTAPGGGGGAANTIDAQTKGGDGGGGERGIVGQSGSGGYASGAGGAADSAGFNAGGNSIKGGAGGGGVTSTTAGPGGTSQDGGNGGAAAIAGAAAAGSGVAPGGGGGGKRFSLSGDGASGAGAAGRVRVWAW